MKLKLFINLIYFIVIVGLFSCTDKNKELFNPNLDSDISFSLSQKGYSVEEMLRRTSQVKIDSSSTQYLLKFETDEIKKDTAIQSFVADVFIELQKDTIFIAKSYDTLNIESIMGRDSVDIKEADINTGEISYEITNYTHNPVNFKLYFMGFTRLSGGVLDTLNITFIAPPNTGVPYKKVINLDGYKYKIPPNQPFQGLINGFWIKGLLTFGGRQTGDSIHVLAKVSNIDFSRIKGRFKPVPVGGNRSQTFVNSLSNKIADFIKGVTFDSVDVLIKAGTTIKDLDVRLKKFSVTGVFKNGDPSILLHFKDQFGNIKDYLDTMITPSQTTVFKFDQSNTDINKFIEKAPDSIKINAELILNPLYKLGEIKANDSIKLSFYAEAWSKWKIKDATITDTVEVEIGQNDRPKFDRGKSGNLTIDVTNNIPIKADLVAWIADSNYQPIIVNGKYFFVTKNNLNDSLLTLNPASVDANGNVIASGTTNIIKDITKEEMMAIKNAYFIIQRYTVNTSNSQIVYITAKQDVKISIRGALQIILTSDDLK